MATIRNPESARESVAIFLSDPRLNDEQRAILLAKGGRDGERAVQADKKLGTRVVLAPGDVFITDIADEVAQIEAQRAQLESAGLTVDLA